MTRRAIIVVVAATVVIAAGIWWQGPLASVLGFGGERSRYLGYVEGETSLIAPPVAGQLLERPVDRGSQVKKGDRLFVIDPTLARAEVARAEAALAEAKARHENLLTGKRPEEQDVIRAQRREIEASLALAETEFKRQGDLLARNFTTRQAYDQAESRVLQLRARLASMAAQERAGDLAARQSEITAAAALIGQSEAREHTFLFVLLVRRIIATRLDIPICLGRTLLFMFRVECQDEAVNVLDEGLRKVCTGLLEFRLEVHECVGLVM